MTNSPYETHYGRHYFETVTDNPGLNSLKYNTCKILDFKLLVLKAGETYEMKTENREYAFDILTGTATFEVNASRFERLGGRKTVFDSPPSGVYAGCQASVKVIAVTDVEIGVGSCPSQTAIEPYSVSPDDAVTGQWGEGNVTRHFRYIINKDRPSERLWFTEVFVQDGCWATYPPHKHEDVPGDLFQEEMYFYKVEPAHGFGFCGQFEGLVGSDYAFVIRNNTIHKMPYGYHTVTAAPGYKIFYLALYAGYDKAHKPSPHPDHANYMQNKVLKP